MVCVCVGAHPHVVWLCGTCGFALTQWRSMHRWGTYGKAIVLFSYEIGNYCRMQEFLLCSKICRRSCREAVDVLLTVKPDFGVFHDFGGQLLLVQSAMYTVPRSDSEEFRSRVASR